MIDLTCPKCGNLLHIPEKYAGQEGKCARCKSAVHVPALIAPKPPVGAPSPQKAPASPPRIPPALLHARSVEETDEVKRIKMAAQMRKLGLDPAKFSIYDSESEARRILDGTERRSVGATDDSAGKDSTDGKTFRDLLGKPARPPFGIPAGWTSLPFLLPLLVLGAWCLFEGAWMLSLPFFTVALFIMEVACVASHDKHEDVFRNVCMGFIGGGCLFVSLDKIFHWHLLSGGAPASGIFFFLYICMGLLTVLPFMLSVIFFLGLAIPSVLWYVSGAAFVRPASMRRPKE